MNNLEGRPLYIGKETIELKDSFFELPYVKSQIGCVDASCLNPLYVNEVHGDHVTALPEGAVLHGSS
jgi:GMP synthase-like glutamine amidotransferase